MEALSWSGTPFDFNQCAKGAGVDCGRFLAMALNAAGKNIDIAKFPKFPPGWFLHRSDESFLNEIRKHATEYRLAAATQQEIWPGPLKTKPEPGDIVIAQCGRDWAHTALVIKWPKVIGSACEHVVTVWENIYRSPQYMNRALKFFDPFSEETE